MGKGQRRGKKGVRETDIGRDRDGGGETYQVSGILFDESLECNKNSNHEVPQFRPTPCQVTPIWTAPSRTDRSWSGHKAWEGAAGQQAAESLVLTLGWAMRAGCYTDGLWGNNCSWLTGGVLKLSTVQTVYKHSPGGWFCRNERQKENWEAKG